MAISWKEMVSGAVLASSASITYTAPSGTSASIQAVSVYNPSALPVTFVLFRVPLNGDATDANRICSRVVPAGSVIQGHEAINHKLEPGTRIMASGLGLSLNISGVEYVQTI